MCWVGVEQELRAGILVARRDDAKDGGYRLAKSGSGLLATTRGSCRRRCGPAQWQLMWRTAGGSVHGSGHLASGDAARGGGAAERRADRGRDAGARARSDVAIALTAVIRSEVGWHAGPKAEQVTRMPSAPMR